MRTYAKKGDWVAICDDCKEKFFASMLVKMWDGKYVCRVNNCYEERHPMDFARVTGDDQSVPWTRPPSAEEFVDQSGYVDTSADDPNVSGNNNGDL